MNAHTKPMKKIVAVIALAVLVAAGSFAYGKWWNPQASAARGTAHVRAVYTCPMHPDYRSDHPGDCPVCGMRLELKPAGNAARGATVYICPMHPNYHSDHPGDGSICGMHLEANRGTSDAAPHGVSEGAVQVSPERQQAIGFRLGVVKRVARPKYCGLPGAWHRMRIGRIRLSPASAAGFAR
jgi:Cu(I)/Ag(I) efflux system membrane fusion protein